MGPNKCQPCQPLQKLTSVQYTLYKKTKKRWDFFRNSELNSVLRLLGPVYTGPDTFGTGSRLGPDRPCIHTGPPGTGMMWAHLPSTTWVHLRKGASTDLDQSRYRVNGQDRSHYDSVSLFMLSNRNVHVRITVRKLFSSRRKGKLSAEFTPGLSTCYYYFLHHLCVNCSVSARL